MQKALTIAPRTALATFSRLRRALSAARDPETLRELTEQFDRIEAVMEAAGMFPPEKIRPVNEARMEARWKLGRALAKKERGRGPGRGKKMSRPETSFRDYLKKLRLDKSRAHEVQRIGTLPDAELRKAFRKAVEQDRLLHVGELVEIARPYWYQESRRQRHQKIRERASETAEAEAAPLGPFPLIYADPPWRFATYSEKGVERTPDRHYPTLSDEEIASFDVAGRPVSEIAHKDAALLMWCTSSNIARALRIMEAWGFEYKSHAIWVKLKADGSPWGGLGLVFRNMHEVLLYGTRGNMPGPLYQPPSVFLFPRGEHSAKPPEIRAEIEKMYPDYDERSRIELFARGEAPGWTCYGFEAMAAEAAE